MKPGYAQYIARPARSQGMTLVELMVAMVISLIVLLAVGTVYFSTKRTYSVQDQFAKMQESALYTFQTMTQDLSSAGFTGCSQKINNLMDLTGLNPSLYDFTTGVYGWEFNKTDPGDTYQITSLSPPGNKADWTNYQAGSQLDDDIAKYAIPGSDVLVVLSARDEHLSPSSNILPTNSKISLNAAPQLIPKNKILLVSDCTQTDVFRNTTAAGPTSGNPSLDKGTGVPSWSHEYKDKEVRIYGSTSRAYFIGQSVSGEPALFRYDLDLGQPAIPEELVEGVENMQVLYGENLGGDMFSANRYVPIDQVTDPHKIYAVRISLLMRTGTVDRAPPSTPLDMYVGAMKSTSVLVNPPQDSRLRKVFTTTIALRNMAVTGR